MAWIHFEQSAILTVHNHVITRNPRISVTHDKHDKHRTWFLHINNVKEEDHGRYMCQINTVTAKTQFGYLHVVGELTHLFFIVNFVYRKSRTFCIKSYFFAKQFTTPSFDYKSMSARCLLPFLVRSQWNMCAYQIYSLLFVRWWMMIVVSFILFWNSYFCKLAKDAAMDA